MESYIIPENVIKKVIGRAIPKPTPDNTDDIVPPRYLKEITFKNMGKYVYADERFINGKIAPNHPFNDSIYSGGNILIGGVNYGSGSSRQHAPEALHRFGIDLIIAESFAEIFAGNCAKIGLVAITVPEKHISELANHVRENPNTKFYVDLVKKEIKYDGNKLGLDIPESRRQAFLNGTWDQMLVLQKNEESIKEVEKKLPYLYFEWLPNP